MNYFDSAPDWNPIEEDSYLYEDIKNYHYYLISNTYSPEGIDGFFFVDKNGFLIIVDLKSKLVKVSRKDDNNVLIFNKKYNFFIDNNERFFYQNQVMITSGKKFYLIVSERNSRILNFLFKFSWIKKLIYCPY